MARTVVRENAKMPVRVIGRSFGGSGTWSIEARRLLARDEGAATARIPPGSIPDAKYRRGGGETFGKLCAIDRLVGDSISSIDGEATTAPCCAGGMRRGFVRRSGSNGQCQQFQRGGQRRGYSGQA